MNVRKLMTAFALALLFSATCVRAQDETQQPPNANNPQAPIPPVAPADAGDAGNNQPPVPAAVIGGLNSGTVDTTIQPGSEALGGAIALGVGSPAGESNVFDPSIHLSVGPDTGINPGQVNADITVGGNLAFNHYWNRNVFTAQYNGGFNIYRPTSVDDSQYHVLSIGDATRIQRTTLRLHDDFTDSSGVVVGGLNTGGPTTTVPTGFVSTLIPTFALTQTILTSNADRIGNTAVGEVDYSLSRRTTLSFVGSYQWLHFLTPGYVDSSNADGHVGYTVQLDRKNSIALTYDYNYTTFYGAGAAVWGQSAQFAYARKISGRMAFQVTGGPQLIGTQGSANQFSWSVATVLTYQMRRSSYSLAYSRGLTGGSGVFLGAETNTINGSYQTTFHRNWTPSLSGGYSDSNSLSINTPGSSYYGSWYGTVALGHLWGRAMHVTASYSLQGQVTNAVACPVASCGPSAVRQLATITLDWHFLPVSAVGPVVNPQ